MENGLLTAVGSLVVEHGLLTAGASLVPAQLPVTAAVRLGNRVSGSLDGLRSCGALA